MTENNNQLEDKVIKIVCCECKQRERSGHKNIYLKMLLWLIKHSWLFEYLFSLDPNFVNDLLRALSGLG